MSGDSVLGIVAREIAAAAESGGAITGDQIASLYGLDRREVAQAIRDLLERKAIRPRD